MLYPQAPAGFSRSATQSLDWQVWPLCVSSHAVSETPVSSLMFLGFFFPPVPRLQFLLLDVHLSYIATLQHLYVLLELEKIKGLSNLLFFYLFIYFSFFRRAFSVFALSGLLLLSLLLISPCEAQSVEIIFLSLYVIKYHQLQINRLRQICTIFIFF